MPPTPKYPGIYVQEQPGGVRTITGVATSITAFVGRTASGPVTQPMTIASFGDFERLFGGFDLDFPLSRAVRDFFLNGGSQAIIVRLYAASSASATARLSVGSLMLEAANPGSWGRKLRVQVDGPVSDAMRPALKLMPGDPLFNLTIRCGGMAEQFVNLTYADTDRRVDRVLATQSRVARWSGGAPDAKVAFVGLAEWIDARSALAAARAANPPVQTAIDAAQGALDRAAAALTDAASQKDAALAIALKRGDPDGIAAARAAVSAAEAAMGGDDGRQLAPEDYIGSQVGRTGLNALDSVDLFNLLTIPPDRRNTSIDPSVWQAAASYCQAHRAMVLVDPPFEWSTGANAAAAGLPGLGLTGDVARNAALYYPVMLATDLDRDGRHISITPGGVVAGIMARTDAAHGVWKAPAGADARIVGVQDLAVKLTDRDTGALNPLGINCLRAFPANGPVVWGARTMRGGDGFADDYKYIAVRRTALFIEESLYRGMRWAVFEPNDEPLWAQLRLAVDTFMNGLFRQGAFQGKTAAEAYWVKCDRSTTSQADIDHGLVNIAVGFAPMRPAEFVIIKLQQAAGQARI